MATPKSHLLITATSVYAVLLFVLYMTTNSSSFGEAAPLSFEAFIAPFYSIEALVIGVIAIMDMIYYVVGVLPMAVKTPKLHLMAVTFPIVIAVLGFIIGLLHANFWVSLPFFALGFLNTLLAYSRIS